MSHDHTRPGIMIGREEHRKLVILAMTGKWHTPEDSDHLNYELDRARIVPDERLPHDVVRMGSQVTYRADGGRLRTVTLVYPERADPAEDRLSILTPVGTALIGLRAGQSLAWMDPDGTRRIVEVNAVRQLVQS
jgi:regulator of nucleoside diphosphate kinase